MPSTGESRYIVILTLGQPEDRKDAYTMSAARRGPEVKRVWGRDHRHAAEVAGVPAGAKAEVFLAGDGVRYSRPKTADLVEDEGLAEKAAISIP